MFGIIAVVAWALSGVTVSVALRFGVDYLLLSIFEMTFLVAGMMYFRRNTILSAMQRALRFTLRKKLISFAIGLSLIGHQLCFIAGFWAGIDALSLAFNYLWPVFLFLFVKHRGAWSRLEIIQIILACMGVLFAVVSGATSADDLVLGSFIGILSAILAATYMALCLIYFRSGDVSALDLLPLSAVVLLPIYIAVVIPFSGDFTSMTVVFGLLMGVMFGAIPELLWVKYVSSVKNSNELFAGAAIPVVGIPCVAVVSGEHVELFQFMAILCLMSAAALSFGSSKNN